MEMVVGRVEFTVLKIDFEQVQAGEASPLGQFLVVSRFRRAPRFGAFGFRR